MNENYLIYVVIGFCLLGIYFCGYFEGKKRGFKIGYFKAERDMFRRNSSSAFWLRNTGRTILGGRNRTGNGL